MNYRARQRICDILAALEAIAAHLQRGDHRLTDQAPDNDH